jgi:hypothetical protein
LYNGSGDVFLGKEKPMADDFLPRADQEFCAWVKHFLQGASRAERLARLGLKKQELEQLQALRGLQADFESALVAQMRLQRQAIAARFSKDDLRKRCEKMARQLAGTLQYSRGLTDGDRADLGLRVRKAPISLATSAQPPASAPCLRVQTLPLRHLLHFVDEQTPTRKRKPPRVAGCEITRWRFPAAGAQARGNKKAKTVSPEENWEFLAFCSATPQTVRFTSGEVQEVGMLVRYRCRWVTHRGQAGPWSNIVAALVNN